LSCGFVDIQFEDPEGAFFIRNDDDILPHPVSPSSSSGESYEGPGDPYKLHQDTGVQDVDGTAVQFTVVQSRQPLSLRYNDEILLVNCANLPSFVLKRCWHKL